MSTSLRSPRPVHSRRPAGEYGRSGSRLGRRRAAAGLAVVCVLALGAAGCALKDARAEASASASASASAAVARAERSITCTNAFAFRALASTLVADVVPSQARLLHFRNSCLPRS